MPIITNEIPLSLYIHLPWCIRKCPYCDFNSHQLRGDLPELLYVQTLLQEFSESLPLLGERKINTIFFGGGTPSLFSATGIKKIIDGIASKIEFSKTIEITLEANPGAVDQERFVGFREAGVNRLSVGVQSLTDSQLKKLGRVHLADQARAAVAIAKMAGFNNFNIDIMFGLPQQTIPEAIFDLEQALALKPTHLSWYQLTLEPNTLFYKHPPALPTDDELWDMQTQGQAILSQQGFQQYEVSAYAQSGRECLHNKNYWTFGDYLGLGAGAHSKLTIDGVVKRSQQVKNPRDYLDPQKRKPLQWQTLRQQDLIFEFMLNAMRLNAGASKDIFVERTGLAFDTIEPLIEHAKERGLIDNQTNQIRPTALGRRFLNDLVLIFLNDKK